MPFSYRMRPGSIILPMTLACGVLWAYWPTLAEIGRKWAHDPQYSHGYLVPAFALFLLFQRRSRLAGAKPCLSRWGIVLLVASLVLRFSGAFFYLAWLDAVSLLPLTAGAVLLLGGKPALRWSWFAIMFLVFMIPLPYRVETGLAQPLQGVATKIVTYSLQTLGFPALSEGNVILVKEARIGVVTACSGLGMLLLFFALATAVAILIRRSMIDKCLIVASAAPIAVASNVIRIAVTAFLHVTVGGWWADLVFHDLAGWLMMPLALGMLWGELRLLDHLLVERSTESLETIPFVHPSPARRPPRKRGMGAVT